MSTVDPDPLEGRRSTAVREAPPAAASDELTPARAASVAGLAVRRLLPLRHRRTVGAWCFVDHYGPASVDGGPGMQVPSHPHTGIQTVTWLFEGDVLHRDSLGTEQLIRAGQLNVMTAGRGIAHSEQSQRSSESRIHGVQLWVALPDAARGREPFFEHHPALPALQVDQLELTVLVGSLAGTQSPSRVFSTLLGADIRAPRGSRGSIPLERGHEHCLLVAEGAVHADGVCVEPGSLLYLATGRDEVELSAPAGARLLLLGGEPFPEKLVMWWNFVGRTADEVAAYVADWANHRRFGDVPGDSANRLPAPDLDLARLRLRN